MDFNVAVEYKGNLAFVTGEYNPKTDVVTVDVSLELLEDSPDALAYVFSKLPEALKDLMEGGKNDNQLNFEAENKDFKV